MKKNIVCVACPIGCGITVELDDGGAVLSVTGNSCKRGDAYARAECLNPVRSLATTIKVNGGVRDVVSCKSSAPLPKGKIMECMKVVDEAETDAPTAIGDALIKNILGTGIDMVATSNCPKK